jgi:hypothetical protein
MDRSKIIKGEINMNRYTNQEVVISGLKWHNILSNAFAYDSKNQSPFNDVEDVFFNSKKGITVIKWKDGTTSKSTCSVDDEFDPFVGFCIAYTSRDMSKSKIKERIQRKFKKNNNG